MNDDTILDGMKKKTSAAGTSQAAVFVSGEDFDSAELERLDEETQMPYPGRPGQVIVLADGKADLALQAKIPLGESMLVGSFDSGAKKFRYYQIPVTGAPQVRRQ